ncbi:hypothetical protein Mal64_26440 [Pseudobythopirellula maris]|uniref:Carboxymuconolactone decarboxylase family protein n=1 Tax=Pseudobythopirellula maris TaxID=2527991 RepID=A0A5C5ZIX8_9BACT|nr:hypothetical protein [Pseudobythopirellula maris]TWT87110.1 hypothetical protein Mal64_26440 [Pseudobythopirellula maris]
MPTPEDRREEIRQFQEHYGYDTSYLEDLLDRSPAAFEVFAAARPMTVFRDRLPVEAYSAAAIGVMRETDCGACLQLNLKIAIEAGVDRQLLDRLLVAPDEAPPILQDVLGYARAVHRGETPDAEAAARIEAEYGPEAFAELALSTAGMSIYPNLKRALLKEAACQAGPIDY